MVPNLKIIPLGGLSEIGKNMTVVEYGNDIIVIDCGMGFPNEQMYGIDSVYPDISYLKLNASKIKGLILTHGHEDHIGAVPYLISQLNVPIYATPLTAALVELKLEEKELLYTTQIFTKKAGSKFRLGLFEIEFIHVNHSIPDSVGLAIKTPIGTVIHTGDFKIDLTPFDGKIIDLARFGELGNEGVLALLSDSTNVEKPGHSDSEKKVGESFDKLFQNCEKRIIITTFASNVHRLQQIIKVAAKYGRKVAVTGRSMENVIQVSTILGYMEFKDGILLSLDELSKLPPSKSVIISTGSQGESMSALYRMAYEEHKQIKVTNKDRVIISASAIPGNENMISRVIDELYRNGAEVFYDRHTDLHVSGHAPQEDLKTILGLVKPKFFIPVHGEYRMQIKHAELGQMMGVKKDNILIADIGDIIEINKKSIRKSDSVPSGAVLVDGAGIGEIGNVVLHDRHRLAEDGMVVVVVPYSTYDGTIVTAPQIVTRGFIYVKENENLVKELEFVIEDTVESLENIKDISTLKSKLKSNVSSYLFKKTKRNPMVMPVVIEL